MRWQMMVSPCFPPFIDKDVSKVGEWYHGQGRGSARPGETTAPRFVIVQAVVGDAPQAVEIPRHAINLAREEKHRSSLKTAMEVFKKRYIGFC
jgi:hypothetical protein